MSLGVCKVREMELLQINVFDKFSIHRLNYIYVGILGKKCTLWGRNVINITVIWRNNSEGRCNISASRIQEVWQL
jgi:hypothetical protein